MEKIYKVLKLLILVLSIVVLILGATRLYNMLSSQIQVDTLATQPDNAGDETAPKEQLAPDFTVYDLEGNAHKLSDFRGKPVILNFWASWCGPCKSEMPDFEEKFTVYGEDIHFVMVNLTDNNQETVESAHAYILEQGYSFPVYFDTNLEAAMAYGVNAIPVTYFIDAQGHPVAWAQSALSAEVLQQGIDMLLKS